MSTARNRFGVSILVALVLAAVVSGANVAAADARSGAPTDLQLVVTGPAEAHEGLGLIASLATAASTRAQVAVALGAGVPMLVIGFMVRRRIYAEAS